jgi:DinB family protein
VHLTQTLRDISNDARGWLTTWARDFTDVEAGATASGQPPNPLLWQLGHLACVEDEVCWLFGAPDRLVAADLRAACSSGCATPNAATRYPPLGDLWKLLDGTHARLLGLLERAQDVDLDRPPREPNRFFRSLGQAVYEVALHETYHVGEIGALRKALGKPRIG